MREPDSRAPTVSRWGRLARSLSFRLVVLLALSMSLIVGLLGYLNIRLQRQHLEQSTLASADRISNVIKLNASYYMLRNEREGLYHLIHDVAGGPGVLRIRIINQEGRISFSSDPKETNTFVDKRSEACYACHSESHPLTRLNRPDRFRTYRLAGGQRALGIINPIENSPACSNAACHYHPPTQEILGVLDTNLSLAATDADMAQSARQMILYTVLAVLAISVLSGLFIWRFVRVPLRALKAGTERLGSGDLGYQLEVDSHDELADLARSFNTMSRQLGQAREEIDTWTKTLEVRVEEKTRELNTAHEQMLRVEKMASIGKLAAVVAHEINNPLAGILTYAKLLKKRFSHQDEAQKEIFSTLDIIETESRRCGEIVKNLLTFARTMPMAYDLADLNGIIQRCVKLVQHQLELGGIELHLDLAPDLPSVGCDAGQVAQVILALVMNAIDAMPRGGILALETRLTDGGSAALVVVRDNGVGMPPEVLKNMFEPFFTTKENAHSLGLGLAICHSIIERHHGEIQVASELGRGTTFTIRLPLRANPVPAEGPVATLKEVIASGHPS
ncbi:MAG TPA: ATP-binding protein [Candidatus Limnocylindrales bacterium]|nr:ATP-binding protein [Candidatus Limnocylindrales bacterium]